MKLLLALALCFTLATCRPGERKPKAVCIKEMMNLAKATWSHAMFRDKMLGLVGHVQRMDKAIAAFGESAKDILIDNPSEEGYEELGRKWEGMTERIGRDFDGIAMKLVKLGFMLYLGGDGFEEVNHCESFKNIPPPDPEAHTMEESLREMGTVFLGDLQCFRDLFQGFTDLETSLAGDGTMSEDAAIRLVLGFVERLHMVALNAKRFKDAVEESVHDLVEAHEQPTEEVKRLLQLRSLLKRSGLVN